MKDKAQIAFVTTFLLGLVLSLVVFMYVYKPYTEKTEALANSNKQLSARVDELKEFYDNMDTYRQQMELMSGDIQDKLKDFPVNALEEDVMYLAVRSLKDEIEVDYVTISIETPVVLGIIEEGMVQRAQVEGFERELVFTQRDVTYTNNTNGYLNMKDLITCMNDNQEELAITNVAYKRDEETGLLKGAIDVSFYTIQGLDREYVKRQFSEYELGLMDLFFGTN